VRHSDGVSGTVLCAPLHRLEKCADKMTEEEEETSVGEGGGGRGEAIMGGEREKGD
jgi:hypothetical protein